MENCLYVVVPCYNEEQVIEFTSKELKTKLESLILNNKISKESKIVFVNDGSTDNTWNLIKRLNKESNIFLGINLSHNVGHQKALLCGLLTAKKYCDIAISIDADLQDDINAIDQMIEKYLHGCDIVYGVRNNRDSDSFFKKFTAELFYKIMGFCGIESIFNHADFRLLSKRALVGLSKFKEYNLFLRGIIPMIGYESDIVFYKRTKRVAGKSKYPLNKMISFALEGITSFSIKPVRMITIIGFIMFLTSIAMLIYVLIKFFSNQTIVGWSSLMLSVWGTGSMILIAIGVVGEYIGKIYLESKHRPKFIIESVLDNDELSNKD